MKKSWKRIIACVICAFMVLSELSLVEPKGFQAMEVYASYAEKKAGDINGDGDLTGFDRNLLSSNWGLEADDEDLLYPRPRTASDAVFDAYDSGDIEVDLNLF